MRTQTASPLLQWCGSVIAVGASTTWAMLREVASFGRRESIQTGIDFSNNTWRAVRGLLSGQNIYGPTHAMIPGMGPAFPVSEHVPASLLWQAPFTVFPLKASLFLFTFASILAIWAAVFILAQPRGPSEAFLASSAGAFVIVMGSGPLTLLLGQPTGFILLGLAVLVRARRPWVAGLGFMLAGSTLQVGLPLALALIVLGRWAIVWRGTAWILACSLPPVGLEIANAGVRTFFDSFISGASGFIVEVSHRIDLGGLLHRAGVTSTAAQLAAGFMVAALALAFLARLPVHVRRLEYPPVLSLVIAFTLLCTYHEPYDMLLIGGLVPMILVRDRSREMQPVFVLAAVSAGLSIYLICLVLDPIALAGIGLFSARAAHQAAKRAPAMLNPGEPVSGSGSDEATDRGLPAGQQP